MEENETITENKMEEIDYKDKYLRALADHDNYMKNARKRNAEVEVNAKRDVIKSFLDIIDDFERAIQYSNDEGLKNIYSKYISVLTKYNCGCYGQVGETFNADIHSCIGSIPTEDESLKNTIAQVHQKGYCIGDTIVRYASVIVYV